MSDQSFDKKHEECLHGIPKGFSCRDCEFMADSLYPQSSIGASEEIDDPFCWYIVQRDITDEYSTVYSEAENCPGPGWKPLYERPVIPSATAAPTRASEAMADAVRGFLQLIRANPGTTFKEVRRHCELRGDDLSKWPEWVLSAEGYVTERVGAMALYEIMAIAASDGNINK
jgi:hypothetical protein